MRLLFDQNLSPQLVSLLNDLYPDSVHVFDLGLDTHDDGYVWEYAQENALTIVSKDTDFRHRSVSYGQPPKVIWIGLGNCTTAQVEFVFRQHHNEVLGFSADERRSLLELA